MTTDELKQASPRRGFLGTLATGAAALGLAAIASPFQLNAQDKKEPEKKTGGVGMPMKSSHPADIWFSKLGGTHRIVFDATQPHELMPFAWPKVFMLTNAATGSTEKECGVVVVLRHAAICYALDSNLWSKYKLGELMKAEDPATKMASTRNPFWKPGKDDFKIPGVGPVEIGINQLQEHGVMFCVCDMAMTVFSAIAADQSKMDAAEVKKEWLAGVLPGIQVVPSGVWAVGRAQERGCKYCFAG